MSILNLCPCLPNLRKFENALKSHCFDWLHDFIHITCSARDPIIIRRNLDFSSEDFRLPTVSLTTQISSYPIISTMNTATPNNNVGGHTLSILSSLHHSAQNTSALDHLSTWYIHSLKPNITVTCIWEGVKKKVLIFVVECACKKSNIILKKQSFIWWRTSRYGSGSWLNLQSVWVSMGHFFSKIEDL